MRHKGMSRRHLSRTIAGLLTAHVQLKVLNRRTRGFSRVPCAIISDPRVMTLGHTISLRYPILLGGSNVLPLSPTGGRALTMVKPGTGDHTTLINGCRNASSHCIAILRKVRSTINPSAHILCTRNYRLCGSHADNLTRTSSHVDRTGTIYTTTSIVMTMIKLSTAVRNRRNSTNGRCNDNSGPGLHLPNLRRRLLRATTSFNGPLVIVALTKDTLTLS